MNIRIYLFVISLFLLLREVGAQALNETVLHKKLYNINEAGVAINGFDPVSYFVSKTPIKGSPKYQFLYKGIHYYFSSEGNKKTFVNSPEKYEPAYGGWCAYAMGNTGEKVKIDPETFKLINSKLYLFYNFYFTNTLNDWNKNEKALLNKANQNWHSLNIH